ncbi:MAG: 50S ribosomal protein L25 [Bacillota bacterium]|nr:MAG: 50S ribosomal protein L25 [Bacillota bacterium]
MKIELRTERLSEIRNKNLVPGVMYGKSIESTNIQVDKQELLEALETYGKNMTFKARLDGKYHYVYIKSVQSRVLKPKNILHFDLHRVTEKETFTSHIPITVVNFEKFTNKSIHFELVLNQVTAEYTAESGQTTIELDVSKLKLGDKIHVKDLKVSEGVTILNHPEDIVLMIKETRVIEEEKDEKPETPAPIVIEAEETSK